MLSFTHSHPRPRVGWRFLVVLGLLLSARPALATTYEVTGFAPVPGTPAANAWYLTDVRMGGTASVGSLAGFGGNLENNQPLPIGAALLTTGFDNGDKAEVGTFGDFGSASSALNSLTAGYSYYKEDVAGGNATAAPSLKLTIFAPGGTGDNYGQLVYEPSWNLGAGSQPPPTGAWQTVSIGPGTGSGSDSTGGWWWTGGFEVPSGAGGPPIRSLAEWAALFQAADPTDFANARIVGISVGVGTYNQGQVGYFDNVSLSVPGGVNVTYDFQPVPEPASLLALGAGLAATGGLGWLRRRRGERVSA